MNCLNISRATYWGAALLFILFVHVGVARAGLSSQQKPEKKVFGLNLIADGDAEAENHNV